MAVSLVRLVTLVLIVMSIKSPSFQITGKPAISSIHVACQHGLSLHEKASSLKYFKSRCRIMQAMARA